MKKIRAFNIAYLIIYLLTAFFVFTSVCLIIDTIYKPIDIYYLSVYSLVSVVFILFSYHFSRVRAILSKNKITFFKSMLLDRDKSKKKACFLFTWRNMEQRIVKSELLLSDLEKYGFVRDLNLSVEEKQPVYRGVTYAVIEIAFVLRDQTTVRFNAKPYTKKQVKKIIRFVYAETNILPDGKLMEFI